MWRSGALQEEGGGRRGERSEKREAGAAPGPGLLRGSGVGPGWAAGGSRTWAREAPGLGVSGHGAGGRGEEGGAA